MLLLLLAIVVNFAVVAMAHGSWALTVDQLPPGRDWRVGGLDIEGNDAISSSTIEEYLLTKQRAWYAPWRERPPFDPVTFTTDLDRVERLYGSRGYYEAAVTYDLEIDAERALVRAHLRVAEGDQVHVDSVEVEITATDPSPAVPIPLPPPTQIPLSRGDPFEEERYQVAEEKLREFYLNRGHAHVRTSRRARVDVDTELADVSYSAKPGPLAVFGETTVTGTESVDPHIVLRELAYQPGDRFSMEKIRESRAAILLLGLFRSVRFTPRLDGPDPRVVPILVEVADKPWHNLRIGAGYGTDDGFRGQIEWRSLNWLGDGRQLSLWIKASQINREAGARFLQPYLLGRGNRGIVDFRLLQDDEETYLRYATQLIPRFQRDFTPTLTGFAGYRIEYDSLDDIDRETIDEIGGVETEGILSAPLAGLTWNTADDPLDPSRGHVVTLEAQQGGGIWGGPFNYWRATTEAKKYLSVGWDVVLAGRLKLGLADAIGDIENLPIFERFYAGGQHGVRGYGRRRLGPLSSSDRPLGGRSLFEGSIEARRPVWRALGGAVFLDFGNVSLDAFDPPVDDLELAPGFGVTYDTPIGPLRLDLGFPLSPPADDQAWQLHFSIGQFF